VERLIESIGSLDHATDCLTCAEAAVALESREAAGLMLEKVLMLTEDDSRFHGNTRFSVIHHLALTTAMLSEYLRPDGGA
jgi:hypothetical protein